MTTSREEGPPAAPPILGLLTEVQRSYGQLMVDHMTARGVEHGFAQSRLMGSIPAEGIRLTELADRLGVTKQAAGEMVDDLVADGYLERRPDPSDRRAKLIVFGPAGHAALPTAWEALQAVEQAMADVIGPDAVGRLREWLAQLAARPPGPPLSNR